jgi:hypothetical protein
MEHRSWRPFCVDLEDARIPNIAAKPSHHTVSSVSADPFGRVTNFMKRPSVLIVGHPGHELRVHGWLETTRPTVMVLTDGSGATTCSRLASTTALLKRAGADLGPIYGRFSDADAYNAVLNHDVALFCGLADEIADVLVRDRIECVVGDRAEGYNPTHDMCRFLINAAVTIARQRCRTDIANFAFPLVARPDDGSLHARRTACIELDAGALQRKLQAAHAYAELADEVAEALKVYGADAFRKEWLLVVEARDTSEPAEVQPFYEQHGERRVAAGVYQNVIRYHTHVRPLANALGQYVRKIGQ